MGARNILSGDFRSYTSGNKPLTCGDGISGIALIELTLYNTSCIDKWLSTRPVFDAGLLPGIGAERTLKYGVRHGRNNEHEAPVETEIDKACSAYVLLWFPRELFCSRETDSEHGGG